MNGTHFAAAGGLTSLISQALIYLTHWPLQPMDDPTAMAFAGLLVIVLGGGGLGLVNMRKPAVVDGIPDITITKVPI